MSKGYTETPWRPIVGSGQTLAIVNGASAVFANPVGAQTRCIQLSTLVANMTFRITKAGSAAIATDTLMRTTDVQVLIGCSPGDQVAVFGLAAGGTAYLTEMTN